MRKVSVIILFAVFITSQYVQQVSYLECRLANGFRSPAEKCDCETLVSKVDAKPPLSTPVRHHHVHLDDLYEIAEIGLPAKNDHIPGCTTNHRERGINDGVLFPVEQPPNSSLV